MARDIIEGELDEIKLLVALLGLVLIVMYAFVVPDERVLITALLVIAISVGLEGLADWL